MKKQLVLYLACGLLGGHCYAQDIFPSIINAAGGSAVVGTDIHEWSVGEMVLVSTETAGTGLVTQGLLQPIYTNNVSIDEETATTPNFVMYPNPTNGNIYLQPDLAANSRMKVRIMDITGKVLSNREIWLTNGNETQGFDLTAFASGIYLLQVEWKQGNETKNAVYRIEKH